MTQNHTQPPQFTVIIVAAGNGTRFGSDTPKQYLPLNGVSVISHSIKTFMSCTGLKNIHVVIHPDHIDRFNAATSGLDISPPIIGGKDRQDSVRNALNQLDLADNDIILIHDAARPCIRKEEIEKIVAALTEHRAVTLAGSVTETIRNKEDNLLGTTLDREQLVAIQTPQGFHFGDIKAAHNKFKDQAFTDDTSLLAANGQDSAYALGPRTNIKITTEEDFHMAEFILSGQNPQMPIIKTAIGFDVHAFGDVADHIRIGGIDIPHTHKLAGHSDADVVLHAITDALYGTIADGDIGSHFPPSDPAHKGKDSTIFLKEALADVINQGGAINHVDVTVIGEAPKIGPHRDAMRQRIAEIMSLPLSRVSVKATTTEKLGFTGRKEGIATQAAVTISISEHI